MRVPKRISSLPTVAKCSGLWSMQSAEKRPSRKSAETGSAAHLACELLHRGYLPEAVCEVVANKHPTADLKLAGIWAGQYSRDPRNQSVVLVDAMEAEVKLELPAHESDETGEPIKLTGHVDQIRRGDDGQLYVWDIKTGRSEAPINEYAWQIAAYALAASATFDEPVLPGGVIRLRSYVDELGSACPRCNAMPGDSCRTKTGGIASKPHSAREPLLLDPATAPVFHGTSWSLDQCRAMLRSFAFLVGAYRSGHLPLTPGDHCRYCPAGGPQICVLELT